MRQKTFRVLADLRFAIFILFLLIFSSVIGTIIEQEQLTETYKLNYSLTNPLFGFLSWNQILKFGLDHVYKTWWFFTLIFVFGFSLTICTFLQQFPSLKIAKRCQFFRNINLLKNLKISTCLNYYKFKIILIKLTFQKYCLFQQRNIFYCYKGLIGQIAPIIVHLSMILILLGTIWSSLCGFYAQEVIPKNDIFHIQNILNNGQLTFIPSLSARVNDFWITYNKETNISQFYSDISILNYLGTEINRQTTFVNKPLIYKELCYYQTDWNLLGLRLQYFDGKIIEYPLLPIFDLKNKSWLSWISNDQNLNKGVFVTIDNLEGYCSIYNNKGIFLGNSELNENLKITKSPKFIEILNLTGLQVKNDPGIQIVYSGFLFLIISVLISYKTYSQIWIIKKNQNVFIGGNTNRAIFEFELEFFDCISKS